MKIPALIVSFVALGLTIVPPILVFTGSMEAPVMKNIMIGATVLWFIAWPLAIREKA